MNRKNIYVALAFASLLVLPVGAEADTIVMDLSRPTRPAEITLNSEGYWDEVYNTSDEYKHVEFGLFSVTHCIHGFGGTDVGGGMTYWDGFVYSVNGDNADYGVTGSSDGWLMKQWGCMAGGGIKTDAGGNVVKDADGRVVSEKGVPYLVGYWGYYEEEINGKEPSCQINFTDGNLYRTLGIYLCNHPWPYYGNIHGDGFARPFDLPGDEFAIYIHGVNERGEDVGRVVKHVFADTEDTGDGLYQVRQSDRWEWVDLSALGSVAGIYFTMTSTDSDPIYGMNTACYFCVDRLTVEADSEARPSRPSGLEWTAGETEIDLTWTASSGGAMGYNVYLDGSLYEKVTATECTVTGLDPYTEYTVTIEAYTATGIVSDPLEAVVMTTDETAPSAPSSITITGTTEYTLTVAWGAASDNVAVKEYHIYLNGDRMKRVAGDVLSYTLTALDPGVEYEVDVEARDAAGNRSEQVKTTAVTASTTALDGNGVSIPAAYPNPTDGVFFLYLTHDQRIALYDLRGVVVHVEECHSGENTVDISHLPSGIYILRCEELSQRIVKRCN